MSPRSVLFAVLMVAACALAASAQFRRGMFAETREVTLNPVVPPAVLLPPGSVQVQVRNSTPASARVADRVRELLGQQLADNDTRLRIAEDGGDSVVVATLTDWNESRRSSTKYVSERRQVGTRQVTDKNGRVTTEPVYEYGRNKPSLVINASAGVRVEVRRRAGGPPLADEAVRHTISEEHLVEEGPPSRDEVEDELLDQIIRKAAGRVSPGREPVRVLLARSDDVDRLNDVAQRRRWADWLEALRALKPNRDRKRDAYRLHNLAVAQEALAYEATAAEEQAARLSQADFHIQQALDQNPEEKYIAESHARVQASRANYARLAEMYAGARQAASAPSAPARAPAAERRDPTPAADAAAMTNKDVIDLRTSGLDDDNLIAAIKAATTVRFDLSPAGLRALLAAKVSNRVIAAMRDRVP